MNDGRFEVMDRYAPLFEQPGSPYEGFVRRRDRKRRIQRITAGAVGIAVFVAAVWFVTTGGAFDRAQVVPGGAGPATSTGLTGSTTPAQTSFPGLPAEDAVPSSPATGELVLRLESVGSGSNAWMWAYEDGRVISHSPLVTDRYPPPSSTGLYEQHLTPEGLEFLRSSVISTGLFESDLELCRAEDGPMGAPFLGIGVRDGDRLVSVRWAWCRALTDPGAPEASSQQAATLESLRELLSDPDAWPADVWVDRTAIEYVPSGYSITIRGIPDRIEPADFPNLLPAAAVDLLGDRLSREIDRAVTDPLSVVSPRLTTDGARALAVTLVDAGTEQTGAQSYLSFNIPDPRTGSSLVIFFEPMLPDGTSVFFGPG